ncbi:hypothetical protein, partial [Mesorhizobium japonicum]|uniref:hypothetical protein n=1 Tax=Mesorhizobium japonicum TaxID=2066070 RepID=UPI003B59A26A
MIALAAAQGAALGVEGAARQASRVYVQASDEAAAKAALRDASAVTLRDYHVDAATARVRIDCTPDPSRCLTRRGFVTVRIDASVDLPFVPPALEAVLPLRLRLQAVATE